MDECNDFDLDKAVEDILTQSNFNHNENEQNEYEDINIETNGNNNNSNNNTYDNDDDNCYNGVLGFDPAITLNRNLSLTNFDLTGGIGIDTSTHSFEKQHEKMAKKLHAIEKELRTLQLYL